MSLWTVQQHEWLQALGHPVMLLAGDPSLDASATDTRTQSDDGVPAARPAAAAALACGGAPAGGADQRPAAEQTINSSDSNRAETVRQSAPAEPVIAPAADATPRGAAPARVNAAERKAALDAARGARRAALPALLPTDDPLLQAIANASGMDAGAFEVAARTWQLDPIRLRAEPSAKRILWQQMRKTRRNRNA